MVLVSLPLVWPEVLVGFLARLRDPIAIGQRQFERKPWMTNIFVGNLSYQTTQEDLQATFSQFGNVERINIVTDRDTGQPRGFAFVEMTSAGDAQNAISQLNGTQLHGRALN